MRSLSSIEVENKLDMSEPGEPQPWQNLKLRRFSKVVDMQLSVRHIVVREREDRSFLREIVSILAELALLVYTLTQGGLLVQLIL